MALLGDDCYFFLNSACVRGSQCTYRHQPASKATTSVCPQWLQGCCYAPNCSLRHFSDERSRNQTPCYYESNMGACYKSRCPFTHLNKSSQAVIPHIPMPLSGVLPRMPPPPPVAVAGIVPPLQNTLSAREQSVEMRSQSPATGLQPIPHKTVERLVANPPPANFNEQVRRFKEMLASKEMVASKKYSDEEEQGRQKKERQKERPKSKKNYKEKGGHSAHRIVKGVKETWSRADEEILYGDYKDVPLDKKSKKKKKHKSHKEYAESDPEIQVKSYEDVLREKALHSNRNKNKKEKF